MADENIKEESTEEKPKVAPTKKKKSSWDQLVDSQVAKSFFRTGVPRTRRSRLLVILNSLWLHLHPARTNRHAVRLRFTWCMGGLSFFLFMVLTVTGILLMFYYRPTVEYAFLDIVDLGEQVPLGIMRELHRGAAHLMVITEWLHMVRGFMAGYNKPAREFKWGGGVI